jgi:hypothetical protein
MSGGLVRGARGYVRNRTEEAHVRPCGTNMGHPKQKLIQDRSETAATRPYQQDANALTEPEAPLKLPLWK